MALWVILNNLVSYWVFVDNFFGSQLVDNFVAEKQHYFLYCCKKTTPDPVEYIRIF